MHLLTQVARWQVGKLRLFIFCKLTGWIKYYSLFLLRKYILKFINNSTDMRDSTALVKRYKKKHFSLANAIYSMSIAALMLYFNIIHIKDVNYLSQKVTFSHIIMIQPHGDGHLLHWWKNWCLAFEPCTKFWCPHRKCPS